jgi:hypothetical protein
MHHGKNANKMFAYTYKIVTNGNLLQELDRDGNDYAGD